jgi:outer membrane lipoprotein-sorting protein
MSPRLFTRTAAGCATALILSAAIPAGAQTAPVPPPPRDPGVTTAATATLTVQDVVARNLQARGGLERVKAVRAMRLKGLMQAANGTDVPTAIFMQRPNRIRQEATLNGRLAVQAFDGERGWALNPMMGNAPVEVPVGVARRMAEQADFDGPLVDTEAKGHRLEFAGIESLGEVKAAKLRLVKKSGEEQFLFFDASTGLEIRTLGEIDQTGRKVSIESRYSDFRTVDGLTVPFTVEVLVNGQLQQKITLSSAEFPASLEDDLFRMPGRP